MSKRVNWAGIIREIYQEEKNSVSGCVTVAQVEEALRRKLTFEQVEQHEEILSDYAVLRRWILDTKVLKPFVRGSSLLTERKR